MDNYIGKKIEGRYLISALIGMGGMANVYKATDVMDGKTVAVKILRPEFYEDSENLRRFKNESKAISMLSHVNIVKVYDVCFGSRAYALVMEYLDGITLKDYMEHEVVLSIKDTLKFTVQILRALSHAHGRGVVHRDIKPQNIMVLDNGSIKITDFGIASFSRNENRSFNNGAIGSVYYISPEQASGDETDNRTDLYSVGAMMYEMVTGRPLFDDTDPLSIAIKQIKDMPTAPTLINSKIPKGLEQIILKSLQKNPCDRYQTADEMLKDISELVYNPTVKFEYDLERENKEYIIKNKEADEISESNSKKKNKKEKKKSKPRSGLSSIVRTLFAITVAFVVVSFGFIGGMLYFNNPLEKTPEVIVPDIVGYKYGSTSNSAKYGSFLVEIEETKYDNSKRGTILSQKPKGGTKAKEGSTIKIVVSNGAKVITMPNIVGYEETTGYAEIYALDLEYEKVEVFSRLDVGIIVSTEPAFGEEVSVGSKVKVMVSAGVENKSVTVPDIIGADIMSAYNTIIEEGLEIGSVTYEKSESPYGTIIGISPEQGTILMNGSNIDIIVSSGNGEKSNQVTLIVPLPKNVNNDITIKAINKNNTLIEETINPAAAKYWKPVFQGSGRSVQINVLYNDFLYQTYTIDFSTGSYRLTEDNSIQHE